MDYMRFWINIFKIEIPGRDSSMRTMPSTTSSLKGSTRDMPNESWRDTWFQGRKSHSRISTMSQSLGIEPSESNWFEPWEVRFGSWAWMTPTSRITRWNMVRENPAQSEQSNQITRMTFVVLVLSRKGPPTAKWDSIPRWLQVRSILGKQRSARYSRKHQMCKRWVPSKLDRLTLRKSPTWFHSFVHFHSQDTSI